jgi:hypothetical protein
VKDDRRPIVCYKLQVPHRDTELRQVHLSGMGRRKAVRYSALHIHSAATVSPSNPLTHMRHHIIKDGYEQTIFHIH